MAHLTNVMGANLADTHDAAKFALGTMGYGTDGSEWVYVQANGAITQYDCVAIDEDYQAAAMTDTLAATSQRVGFAQVAFTDNYYGWVALRGSNISVRVRASCAADAQLWTTASAGILDDASVSAGSMKVDGVVIVTAATSSGVQAEECIASFPTIQEGS